MSTKVNPNLLDNSVFLPGCLVDQRQGRVVIPNTTYYSDNQLTTSAGTTSAYVTAYRYATGTASGVNYASFKLEDTDTAPTYYAAPANVVRGYTGVGYGPDRWTGNGYKVLLINDDCITFKNTTTAQAWFGEWMDNLTYLNNREFTLSILYRTESSNCGVEFFGEASSIYRRMMLPSTDGKWNIASITIPAGSYFGSNTKARWGAFVDNTAIGSIDIKGFGIDLGTQQTLAHQDSSGNWQLNELPNYADTLARCNRQQVALSGLDTIGVSVDTKTLYFNIPTPVPMRTVPSIENNGVFHVRGNGEYQKGLTATVYSTSLTPIGIRATLSGTFAANVPYYVGISSPIILNSNL